LGDTNDALRKEMLERASIEDSRMQLLSQLVSAQEDERRRFALDLHDQLGQQLTTLKMKLEGLNRQVTDQPDVSSSIEEVQKFVRQLNNDVDFLAWQMRPVALDDLGLSTTLKNYVNNGRDTSLSMETSE